MLDTDYPVTFLNGVMFMVFVGLLEFVTGGFLFSLAGDVNVHRLI